MMRFLFPFGLRKTVELILDDLQVYSPEGHRQTLHEMQELRVTELHVETELAPPGYSPASDSKHFPGDKKVTSSLNGSNIVAQLESTVH